MSFSVATNISSITARTMMGNAQSGLKQPLHPLSSGSRINSSADDAAGIAVANRHRMDNAGHRAGAQNAYDAVGQLQIQDGALSNISSLMDRATTLASQAASDTFTGDRAILNEEFQSVLQEISRTATAAGLETGGTNLDSKEVFVGNTQTNTSDSVSYISVAAKDGVDTAGLGLDTQSILDQGGAAAAISNLQSAVGALGAVQARTGSSINQLSSAASQAQRTADSLQASESRIRDANFAEVVSELTKNQMLTESGLAAMAYGDVAAKSVVKLLA